MLPLRRCVLIPHRLLGSFPNYSSDTRILSSLDTRSKSAKIQSSIKLYLKRIQNYENMLATERVDFERGRKYLAQIMGEDPETFTQDKIDETIQYLFPSGIFAINARPRLKPPEEVYPRKKKLQCDSTGRPNHDMFYTRYPNYFSLMHEAVYQSESLKAAYDNMFLSRDWKLWKNQRSLLLVSTEWFDKARLEEEIGEKINDDQYNGWLAMMNRIANHPFAHMADSFIGRFRYQPSKRDIAEIYPEPLVDPDTNRHYIKSYGQKRYALGRVTMYMPGSGQISVNGNRLLEVFPDLSNREQIMFPLQLTGTLGSVDIVASVTGEGTSSPANAIRLAISRCLASLLPQESRDRLRVCGLLTQDDRCAERKKPGQKKARKKPIWKAR